MNNLFCDISDLKNEASVEKNFVDRLLKYLNYSDSDISLKESISEFAIGKGNRKLLYRPDYILKIAGIPTIVIDAKSTAVDITDWEHQCSSYCLELNKEYDYNPVEYYVLTNGLKTSLYKWDKKGAVISLGFDNFREGDAEFGEFKDILDKNRIKVLAEQLKDSLESKFFQFRKVSLDELGSLFQKLHQEIWKSEKKGPAAAFHELIKVFFVKVRKDKEIHNKLGKEPRPKYKDVSFSSNWISLQTETNDPINDILFKNLLNDLEKDIMSGKKKRFFEKNDIINISAGTLKKIVKEIENVDLFGMEEDIHGRMFEAFLEATIRGKDIGQFFTPRDIVELMVDLGDPKVTKAHVDKVLDACCGSGGFLISSLTEMLKKAARLKGLSSRELADLDNTIKLKSIFGIDAGSDPAMYKIARMNMYLHGDGGSNIYYADSLDKTVGRIGSENLEVDRQIDELRSLLVDRGVKFDLILSNPPFSLEYTRDNREQAAVLNQYDLSRDPGTGKLISKLISSVMFIERYKDLVTDDGRIVAIIDDSVLSGTSYEHVRSYIRDNFIIEGIVSLPGDAFKRASARVKTSVMILRKKVAGDQQRSIFLASAIYLGLEGKIAKRIGIDFRRLKELKEREKDKIIRAYREYLAGHDSEYVFDFGNCHDRLDVKFCINDRGRKSSKWSLYGYDVKSIGSVLDEVKGRDVRVEDDRQYQLLTVNYDGDANDGEILDGAESSYSKLYQVRTWDLLISNMGFARGAITVIPPYHDGKYVSNEYTILRAKNKSETVYYWNLLRAKEILGDVFSSTTGMNRGRIKWDVISDVLIPSFKPNEDIERLTNEIEAFWGAHEKFVSNRNNIFRQVSADLDIDGEDSFERWLSFKSPE